MKDLEKMQASLAKAERVKELKDTLGWQQDINPMLEKLISGATGGIINGKWFPGKIFKTGATEQEINQAIGQAKGLISIYNEVNNVDSYIVNIKDQMGKE